MLATTSCGSVWSSSRSPVLGMNCIGPMTRIAVAAPTSAHRHHRPSCKAHTTSVPTHGMNQTQWWLHAIGDASREAVATTQTAVNWSPRCASRRASTSTEATTIAPSVSVTARGGCGSRNRRADMPRMDWFVT